MRYLIIGLGIYGSNLATELTALGHEVIGADSRPEIVENIKDNISAAYIIDSTDAVALSVLPLKNVDVVIVAIGENFGASIRTVALLKKLKVAHIFARALDELHHSILEGFEIDRILTPEKRAAHDLVCELSLGTKVETLKVDTDRYILKFNIPQDLVGRKISPAEFFKEFALSLLSLSRPVEQTNAIGIAHDIYKSVNLSRLEGNETFASGDQIICMGTKKNFRNLFDTLD